MLSAQRTAAASGWRPALRASNVIQVCWPPRGCCTTGSVLRAHQQHQVGGHLGPPALVGEYAVRSATTKGPRQASGRRKSAVHRLGGQLTADSSRKEDEGPSVSQSGGRSRGRMTRLERLGVGERARRLTGATIPKFPCVGLSVGCCVAVVLSRRDIAGRARVALRAREPTMCRGRDARGRYVRHSRGPVCLLRWLE